jgi:MtrB/PioB family decaheme-associated outer membrane protein
VPGDSHNNSAENFFGNLALTSRPIQGADFRASYTIDARENHEAHVYVPSATYMLTSDGGTHGPIGNTPLSTMTQTGKLEAGYRVIPSTKVSLNYTYTDKQQDYSVTDRNHENAMGGRVNTAFTSDVNGSLGYTHSVRTASAYNDNAAWMANGYLSGASNPQGVGMYYLAARTRDEVKGNVSAGITDSVTVGLNGRLSKDNYPNSLFGVTNDHTYSAGPDVSFVHSKSVTSHFFYTFEEVYTAMNSTTSNNLAATSQRTDWTLNNKDTVHTVGMDTDWHVNDKLKVRLFENLSYGGTNFDEGSVFLGSPTPMTAAGLAYFVTPGSIASSLPASKTVTASIGFSGEYQLADNISLLGGYSFERSMDKDYLFGQQNSSSNGTTVSSIGADGNPSYAIHVIQASVRVKW